jgi:hypothetical protein
MQDITSDTRLSYGNSRRQSRMKHNRQSQTCKSGVAELQRERQAAAEAEAALRAARRDAEAAAVAHAAACDMQRSAAAAALQVV